MTDPKQNPWKLTPSRIFLLVFFGIAVLLSITTIIGSVGQWGVEDTVAVTAPQQN